ncbi:concanavalin A-like lectin/glucanase domain-containing protein [Dichotomocladium elegans]|nr:concanavalin A-like lectin/glucanase domain-containing protein [Dichotomocladium elegans]
MSKYVELLDDTEVHYIGPGTQVSHAGMVRSNYPAPPECGLFYFEVHVLNKGVEGYIGIGFSAVGTNLNRLPGWDRYSWGYHGDDGKTFDEHGQGQEYGPKFTTGDVIGCGMDIAHGRAFYTKNGVYLGIAFTTINTSIALYPCVGLNTSEEHVFVNFGQQPFVYDIEGHVRRQRRDTMLNIAKEWGAL